MPPTPATMTLLAPGANGGYNAPAGSVAQRLLKHGFRTSSLRTLDVLRKEEWVLFDEQVVDVATKKLVAVGDLINAGLSFDLPNAMGKLRLEWEQLSDMEPAEINMAGVTLGEKDRVEYNLEALPLPIIHKDFQINIRNLEASRERGEPLDVTQVRIATRLVSEAVENLVFNGATIQGAGGTQIFGYTTATNRNTASLGGDWTGRTGVQIVDDVLAMVAVLAGDNMYGPYRLYIPTDYWITLLKDYDASSGDGRTILGRILEIPNIQGVSQTQDLAKGASGEVVLVQMDSETVDMINGFQPTLVDWQEQGGMISMFKVMAIMIPRVRNDFILQSGIAHFSV